MSPVIWPRLLVIGALCLSSTAWSHAAVIIARNGLPVPEGLREGVTLTEGSLLKLAPIDQNGDGQVGTEELEQGSAAINAGLWLQMPIRVGEKLCEIKQLKARVENGVVQLLGLARCEAVGAARQEFRVLSVLPANYRVDVTQQIGAELKTESAQGRLNTVLISRGSDSTAAAGHGTLWLPLVLLVSWLLLQLLTAQSANDAMLKLLIGGAAVMLGRAAPSLTWASVLVMALLTAQLLLRQNSRASLVGAMSAALMLGTTLGGSGLSLPLIAGALVAALLLSPLAQPSKRRLIRFWFALGAVALGWLATGFQLAAPWFP